MKALRFLCSEGLSDCCNSRMLLVRSREGGFVSRNCLRCGKPDYVGQHHLPDLDCDFCGTRLGVRTIESNYFYLCGQWPPMGTPNCPSALVRAIRVQRLGHGFLAPV